MQPLSTSFVLTLLSATASAHVDGGCPAQSACHLPRWEAADENLFDRMGSATAIHGKTAVVGAPGADAVLVYARLEGVWTEVQRVESPDDPGTYFGNAVALYEDRLVVGAVEKEIDGEEQRGAIHFFERNEGTFEHVRTFNAGSNLGALGQAVAVGPEWIVGGAPGKVGGRVLVYREDGEGWTGWSIGRPGTVRFGASLALEESTLLIGDWLDDTTVVGGGAAYYYEVVDGGAVHHQTIAAGPLDANDNFAFSIGFDGSVAVFGAPGDDDLGSGAGAAYVYERDPSSPPWVPFQFEDKLTSCDGTPDDFFGRSVAARDGKVAVGAPFYENPFDPKENPGGRVYLYNKIGITTPVWTILDVLTSEGGLEGDNFGDAISLGADQVLVGASTHPVIDLSEGAAYLFTLQSSFEGSEACPCDRIAESEAYGAGKPGTHGVPVLELTKPPVLGRTAVLKLSNVVVGSVPVFLWGTAPAAIPFDGGELLVSDPNIEVLPAVGALQQVGLAWDIPEDPALCGADFYGQAMLVDPGASGDFNTAQSNGVVARPGV